jgi:acyl carrier protein
MSTKEEVQAAIREFILQQFPAARKHGVSDGDSLLEQSCIDSMGVLEIVTFIESTFDLTLSDDELMSDHFESIDALANLVHHKMLEGASWTS